MSSHIVAEVGKPFDSREELKQSSKLSMTIRVDDQAPATQIKLDLPGPLHKRLSGENMTIDQVKSRSKLLTEGPNQLVLASGSMRVLARDGFSDEGGSKKSKTLQGSVKHRSVGVGEPEQLSRRS